MEFAIWLFFILFEGLTFIYLLHVYWLFPLASWTLNSGLFLQRSSDPSLPIHLIQHGSLNNSSRLLPNSARPQSVAVISWQFFSISKEEDSATSPGNCSLWNYEACCGKYLLGKNKVNENDLILHLANRTSMRYHLYLSPFQSSFFFPHLVWNWSFDRYESWVKIMKLS